MNNYLFGITLTLIGTAINNFGIVLQKQRVNHFEQLKSVNASNLSPNYFKDIWWDLGIFMQVVLCVPFFLIAVGYIGITLAQPLGNAGVLFLVLGLVWGLHERLQLMEWFGVCILIVGMILIGVGGVEGTITFFSFLKPLPQYIFYMFMASTLIVLLFCIIIGKKFSRILPTIWGFGSGLCYAFVSLGMQLISLYLNDQTYRDSFWFLILGLILTIGGTISAIYLTQEAFKRSQAINIIPFAQIPINILPVIAGIFIFGQILQYPYYFIIGLMLIIIASSFLARLQK